MNESILAAITSCKSRVDVFNRITNFKRSISRSECASIQGADQLDSAMTSLLRLTERRSFSGPL